MVELQKSNPSPEDHGVTAAEIVAGVIFTISTGFFAILLALGGALAAIELSAKVMPLIYLALIPILIGIFLIIMNKVKQTLPEEKPQQPPGTAHEAILQVTEEVSDDPAFVSANIYLAFVTMLATLLTASLLIPAGRIGGAIYGFAAAIISFICYIIGIYEEGLTKLFFNAIGYVSSWAAFWSLLTNPRGIITYPAFYTTVMTLAVFSITIGGFNLIGSV